MHGIAVISDKIGRFFPSRFLMPLLFVVGCVPPAAAQVGAELAQKAANAAEIVAMANQAGYVRVVVEFARPAPANQALRPDAAYLAKIKRQIASMQEAIIATHFGSATDPRPGQGFPRGLLRFDISSMFAVNVTRAEVNALAADSRVIRIHLDRLTPPVLLQSVPGAVP